MVVRITVLKKDKGPIVRFLAGMTIVICSWIINKVSPYAVLYEEYEKK
jgi:hypothetical protein